MKRISAIVLACIIALTIASAAFAAGRTLACSNPHCPGTLTRVKGDFHTDYSDETSEPGINHITGKPTTVYYRVLHGYWDIYLICSHNSSHNRLAGRESGEIKQLSGYAD